MTVAEHAKAVEIVVNPRALLAGVGHLGFEETRQQLEPAAEAGEDFTIIVTSFYFEHDQNTLAAYYREVAEELDALVREAL